MKLDEFVAKYPTVTRKQIATIAGCKLSLVNRWFISLDSPTRMSPQEDHEIRFDIADWLWTQQATEPPFFEKIRRMNPNISG